MMTRVVSLRCGQGDFVEFFKLFGPNRYCPYCKRLLISINNDGTFNMPGHTVIEGRQTITWKTNEEPQSETVEYEVKCLRRKCRFKRIMTSVIRL